jgi:ectoine hydroxylase-related dioxygenase (phytanoyl-CoA dioxygenase family)
MGFDHPLRALTDAEIECFNRDGVVHLRQVLHSSAVKVLHDALSEIFERVCFDKGLRTDMTTAAERASANGSNILQDDAGSEATGRYLTEIEAGRWNRELRRFEHEGPLREICAMLLKSHKIHYFMDHCFLKEPRSKIRTAFHQDSPYFPVIGDQMAVCWCPVDSVNFESGAMGYVKGSHKWPDYAPNLLVSQDRTHFNNR